MPAFIVTGADIEPRKERNIEYTLCLHRIFSFGLPTYGVLSEWEGSEPGPFLSLASRFSNLVTLRKGVLDGLNKSQKEFVSIKNLLDTMDLDDDEFIIKVSGRYLLLNDSFVNLVKSAENASNINAIVRLCDNDTQQYTFLYAMRFKYFKEFYQTTVLPPWKNIERAVLEFIHAKGLYETTLKVSELGILTNINGEGDFKIF
jgi:hypothetical protein